MGDRQFWITRPYRWPNLLASKALFLATWIALPLLFAEVALLATAGFHPLANISGALHIVLLLCDVLVLPVFAVAAVTSNLGRLTLTLLITFGAALVFSNWINFFRTGYVPYLPQSNPFLSPLLAAGCVAALALVYATRRIWLTRTVLLTIPLLLAGTALLSLPGIGGPDLPAGSSRIVGTADSHPYAQQSLPGSDAHLEGHVLHRYSGHLLGCAAA